MMTLLRRCGLSFQRRRLAIRVVLRRLVFVFFVHKLKIVRCSLGGSALQFSVTNSFFRPATWPAFRQEYLDLNRRSERHHRLRGHHTSAAPAGPRPHRPAGLYYRDEGKLLPIST